MLDHPDARDRVEALVAQLAVVGDQDLDAVSQPRVAGVLARQLRLRLRERHAEHLGAVPARSVQGEAPPPAADVEHALALLQGELGADQLELGLLRLLERGRPTREVRAAIRHRHVQEQCEELVADVVVVAYGAPVAGEGVALAAQPQLRARRARGQHEPTRTRSASPSPSRACRRSDSGGGSNVSTIRSAALSSSTSIKPATYARPIPSSPGARSTWASALGDSRRRVGPPASVAATSLPSQNASVNGRSVNAACSSLRSGAVSARLKAPASRRLRGDPGVPARRIHAHYVTGQAHQLEHPDHRRRRIELPAP